MQISFGLPRKDEIYELRLAYPACASDVESLYYEAGFLCARDTIRQASVRLSMSWHVTAVHRTLPARSPQRRPARSEFALGYP